MNKAAEVRITVNTPGWEIIQRRMENKIEECKLAALVNTDEKQVLELWRRAQVADQFFRGLLRDIEQLLDN